MKVCTYSTGHLQWQQVTRRSSQLQGCPYNGFPPGFQTQNLLPAVQKVGGPGKFPHVIMTVIDKRQNFRTESWAGTGNEANNIHYRLTALNPNKCSLTSSQAIPTASICSMQIRWGKAWEIWSRAMMSVRQMVDTQGGGAQPL